MSAPNCPKCGALSTNPSATQCMYCGQALAPAAPQAQQAQQQGYGPPAAFGAPPGPGYGGYGGPQPPQYGGPQPPQYGGPPVQPFGGPPVQPFGGGSNFYSATPQGGFMSTIGSIANGIFWIRLVIALFVFGIIGLASCINALTH